MRWPCYVAFDLLIADDELLTGQSYQNRRQRLSQVLRPNPTHVELQPCAIVTDTLEDVRFQKVMKALDQVILLNKEGLILKSLSSPYAPGETGRNKGFVVFRLNG